MGKTVYRTGIFGLLLVVAPLVPGTARAADPALSGSCAATLRGDSEQPLTLDAGAPVDAPGALTVGTDSGNAARISLPVAKSAKALGIGDTPAVGAVVVGTACPAVQSAVNTVAAAAQDLLTNPGRPGPAPKPPAGVPEPAPEMPPVNRAGGGLSLVSFPSLGVAGQAKATAAVAEAPRPTVPDSVTGRVARPPVDTPGSGVSEAQSPWSLPERLPLLLAVLALAVVTGGLARSWSTRRTA